MEAEPPWDVTRAVTPGIISSSLKVGGLAGVAGLGMGGIAGLLRSTTPALFAAASGIQCFTLGGTYWAVRQTALVYQARRHSTDIYSLGSRQRLEASTIAGGVTGATVAALFRGPSNIIPGSIMFSLFGFLGQGLYTVLDTRHAKKENLPSAQNFWERMEKSRLSPMKYLKDEEYADMLKGKLILIEAKLALVDENIDKTRAETVNSTEKEQP